MDRGQGLRDQFHVLVLGARGGGPVDPRSHRLERSQPAARPSAPRREQLLGRRTRRPLLSGFRPRLGGGRHLPRFRQRQFGPGLRHSRLPRGLCGELCVRRLRCERCHLGLVQPWTFLVRRGAQTQHHGTRSERAQQRAGRRLQGLERHVDGVPSHHGHRRAPVGREPVALRRHRRDEEGARSIGPRPGRLAVRRRLRRQQRLGGRGARRARGGAGGAARSGRSVAGHRDRRRDRLPPRWRDRRGDGADRPPRDDRRGRVLPFPRPSAWLLQPDPGCVRVRGPGRRSLGHR